MIKKIQMVLFYMVLMLLPICSLNLVLPKFLLGWKMNASLIPALLGIFFTLIYYLINKSRRSINNKEKDMFKFYVIILLYIVLNSIIMYCIFVNTYPDYYSALSKSLSNGILNDIVISFVVVLYSLVNINEYSIKKTIKTIVISMTIIITYGYIQLLAIKSKSGFFFYIYSHISNIIDHGWGNETVFQYAMNGRLNLTTPEASEAGAIVTILFVPFLLSSILTGYSSFKSKFLGKISYELILFLITMPIIFFTLSSSIYICVVLQIIAFLIIFYNKKIVFIAKYLVTFVIVILVICAISFVNFKSGTFNDIGFYISKITDLGVTSTSTRFGVIVAALKVFMKYPLNGTGHTNISIFMINNLPDWSFNSEIVSYINQGKDFTGPRVIRTIASNGIIGIVLCVLFIKNMYKRLKQYTDIEGKYMYNSFTFFLIASIVQGINSSDFKFMYLWVVFALFISATEKKVIT